MVYLYKKDNAQTNSISYMMFFFFFFDPVSETT